MSQETPKDARIKEFTRIIAEEPLHSLREYSRRLGVPTHTTNYDIKLIRDRLSRYTGRNASELFGNAYTPKMTLEVIQRKYRWLMVSMWKPEIIEINHCLERIADRIRLFNVDAGGVVIKKKGDDLYRAAIAAYSNDREAIAQCSIDVWMNKLMNRQ